MNIILSLFLVCQVPGQVLWAAPGPGGIYCAIPTYDYNNDGHPDVVAGVYYGAYPTPSIKLYLRSGIDGQIIWTRTDCQGLWGSRGLRTISDISGDSIPDIIMGTPGGVFPGRTIFAINGLTSQTIWYYCYYPNAGWVYSVSPMVDIDNDGFPEVLVGAGGTTNDRRGFAQCFSGRIGTSLWYFRPDDAVMCITPHTDLNGDGIPEVLVAAGGNSLDNRIYCLNGTTGAVIWSYLTPNSVEYVLSIGDVNGNGIPDVVGGGWAYILYCLEGSNGSLIWQNNLGSGRVIYELRKIRDVNGDGYDDIVVGSWSSLVSVVSGYTGSILWSTNVGSDCWNVDTMPDLNGDGISEVVVGALNGRLVMVINGQNGSPIWQYSFLDRIYDVACAGDLNGDGEADVLVALQDQQGQANHLYAFRGLPLGTFEEGIKPIKNYRCRYYKDYVLINLEGSLLNKKLFYTLYDFTGRSVENGMVNTQDQGVTISINKTNKASGVYFLHIKSQEIEKTLKLVLY